MQTDLKSELHATRCIEPRVIMAGNATYTGQIIDKAGFEAVVYTLYAGTLTDATYTCDVYESDDSGMAGETAALAASLSGQAPAFTFIGAAGADSNKVKAVGYIGQKRYTRLKIVQSGATTGGYIGAICHLGKARNLPTT